MQGVRFGHFGYFCSLACGFVLLAAARPARAQVLIDANQLDGKLPDWVDPAYAKTPPHKDKDASGSHDGRVWVAPVYRTVVRRCWCEPVYRPICRRVWHEPVIQVSWDRVWVPARYEWIETCCGDRERVCVEPGHYDMCRREVVVRAGWWEEIEVREAVTSGHFEDHVEQELIAAGHWE